VRNYIITSIGQIKPMPEPKGDDGKYTLKQLQESVGGYIERVLPPVESDVPKGLVFLVDEEGLLKPKTLNALATAMLGAPVVGDLVVIDQELMK